MVCFFPQQSIAHEAPKWCVCAFTLLLLYVYLLSLSPDRKEGGGDPIVAVDDAAAGGLDTDVKAIHTVVYTWSIGTVSSTCRGLRPALRHGKCIQIGGALRRGLTDLGWEELLSRLSTGLLWMRTFGVSEHTLNPALNVPRYCIVLYCSSSSSSLFWQVRTSRKNCVCFSVATGATIDTTVCCARRYISWLHGRPQEVQFLARPTSYNFSEYN